MKLTSLQKGQKQTNYWAQSMYIQEGLFLIVQAKILICIGQI